jgi:hypothetical protein
MPVGGKGKPAGGYRAGAKGSYGCDGYPTVSSDGTVHGCHPTKAAAAAQARAIWASVNSKKNIEIKDLEKASFVEGDFALISCEDEIHVGRIEYVMTNGASGIPGSEYYIETSMDDPAIIARCLEFDSEGQYWEETEYLVAAKASDATKIAPLTLDAEAVMVDGNLMPDPSTMPEMGKADKPNYSDMIKPRKGGSTPTNPRLYAAIVREAKDKFDVYPSAVANGWVVQEYKRRGGTYKGEGVEKKDYSMDTRRRMAESGQAMPDGSFPIADKGDLMDAIRSVGRASNYNAAKRHIISRARALDAMEMLPEDWKNKATKGMTDWAGSIFDLNPFVK